MTVNSGDNNIKPNDMGNEMPIVRRIIFRYAVLSRSELFWILEYAGNVTLSITYEISVAGRFEIRKAI